MNKTFFSITIVGLLLISGLLVFPVSSKTIEATDTDEYDWYVDDIPGEGPDNPPEDFTSIQAAIDNATSGQSIFVYNGNYTENIVINKANLTLKGEDNENTIINAKMDKETIEILTNCINISNFKLSPSYGYGTITFKNCNRSFISNNFFDSDNYVSYGIYLKKSSNIIIENNYFSNLGIRLSNSKNNNFSFNTIINNRIFIEYSSDNMIYNNIISNLKNGYGIRTEGKCYNNQIKFNIIKNCSIGVYLGFHGECSFSYNDFITNERNVFLYSSDSEWYHNYWGPITGTFQLPFFPSFKIPPMLWKSLMLLCKLIGNRKPVIGMQALTPRYIYLDFDKNPALKPNNDFERGILDV